MVIADPLFYPLAIAGFLLNGISKGGFASGAGNVAVPVMALVIPAPQAVGIALPVLCAMDVAGLRAWWGRWSLRELRHTLPGGMLGIGLGALLFGALSAAGISLLVGLVTLAFLARSLWRARGAESPPPAAPGRGRAAFWGAASGLASTVAHAGGPPLAVYLYPLRLDRATLAATTTVFFAAVNYAKLPPYWALGLLDASNLLTALLLLPVAPLGIHLGVKLQGRLSERAFYRIVHVLLAVTGTKLVWDGLA